MHSENKHSVRNNILIPLRLPPVGYSLFYTLVCYTTSTLSYVSHPLLTLARYIQLGKTSVLPLVPAPFPWPRSRKQAVQYCQEGQGTGRLPTLCVCSTFCCLVLFEPLMAGCSTLLEGAVLVTKIVLLTQQNLVVQPVLRVS